jgi:hypothetical protein
LWYDNQKQLGDYSTVEEEKAFLEKYGFTNFQTVTVANPTAEDHQFQVMIEVGVDRATGKMRSEAKTYVVKAGGHERFPGVIAGMYLDQMSKKIAQGMKEGLAAIVNWNSRSKIYDDLIVDVDDLLNRQYQAFEDMDVAKAVDEGDKPEATFAGARKSQNAAK